MLDINGTHKEMRIFPQIRQDFTSLQNRIDALKDGLGLRLFRPMQSAQGEEPFFRFVNSTVQALSSSQGMGIRQIGTLREAVIWTIQNVNNFQTEEEAFLAGLDKQEAPYKEVIYERFWTILNCGVLKPCSKKIQQEKINIIDFSEVDVESQKTLAEIFLSYTWRRIQLKDLCFQPGNLVIVLDEFQNFSLKKDGILRNMLREGRKFGISFVLATQTMEVFSKEALAILNQTATRLYFRPAQSEGLKVAKEIDPSKAAEWQKQLMRLQRGESIAVGNLCVEDSVIRRPLLVK